MLTEDVFQRAVVGSQGTSHSEKHGTGLTGVSAALDIDEDIKKFQKKKKEPEGLSDYVVVHWNGKSLLLPRAQLDDWYEQGPEDRMEYVHDHPDMEIKM